MLSRKELIQTPEYLHETIQNELYRQVKKYMDVEGLNQTQLAKKLGVSRSYISQILNGYFNFSLLKLIEISIKVGVIPVLNFVPVSEYLDEDEKLQKQKSESKLGKIINIDYQKTTKQKATGSFQNIPSKTELEPQYLTSSN